MLVIAALAAGIGLLAMRWRDSGFQWDLFGQSLISVRWPWLWASYILILLTYYGRVLRWEVMIRPICPRPNHWRLLSATLIGFTALVLLGRAGELVRPYLIAKKEGLPVSSQMAAWLLERIYDILIVLLAFGFALTQVPARVVDSPHLQYLLDFGGRFVFVLAILCLAVLVMMRWFADTAQRRIGDAMVALPEPYRTRLATVLNAFLEGVQSTRSLRSTSLLLLYTLLEWLLIAGCYLCLFQSFPATAWCGWRDVMCFLGFVSVGSIVQIPGVGGGMQVVGVIVLTELLHVPLEAAAGVSLMIWLMTFVAVVPIGTLLAFREGLNWRKLKTLKDQVPS
ncbi:MAG: lysylphosphatidylglycerol synthase transmembrane domain-containing protein [Bryobacteraceae bacterium]